MVKKILFILFLSISSFSFSQEKFIENLSAAPNPFINYTQISFTSPYNSTVYFTVKNVLGKTLLKKKLTVQPGKNNIPFYKNNLPSGIYIYTIQSNKKIISKRLVIR